MKVLTSATRRALLATLVVLACASAVHATTVVPVPDDVLARDAVAIVIGRVKAIDSHLDASHRQIFTRVTLTVDEMLKGSLPVTELTLRQIGGTVGTLSSWIEGSPEFTRGERVLVFLSQHPDGTLRVAHLFQGKFTIRTDAATGDEIVERVAPQGVHVLGGGTAHGRKRLEEMKGLIRSNVTAGGGRQRGFAVPPMTDVLTPSGATVQATEAFTFLSSPSRWFEPDSGVAVPIAINSGGESIAPGLGFDQIRAAESAWSSVSGSAMRYRDAGFTTAVGFQQDGVNAISFGDPLGQMDAPVSCSGTLAIGGYFRTSETRTVNGTVFYRITEGDVAFNDGWGGCGFYESFSNMAEVATHELGHVLGLGHSTDPTATMYAYAHFDGRGAALEADDIAGVAFIYPAVAATPTTYTLAVVRSGTGSGTVTSSPAGISCGSVCSASYSAGTLVTLTAKAATGSTFAGWTSGGCTGTSTCRVTLNAATTVTATFNTTTTTTSGLTASFLYPAPGAIVKGYQSIGMSTNLWGTAKKLTLYVDGRQLIVVSTTGTTRWYTWNSRTVANGTHTLKLVVSNATGSATATLNVTVAN